MLNSFVLISFTVALGWTLTNWGGIPFGPRPYSLLELGLSALIFALFSKRESQAPALPTWVKVSLAAIPCYFVFQLVPMPLAVVRILSPARESLVAALTPIIPNISSTPLSVNPSATLLEMFMMMAYIAVFLLSRQISWRTSSTPWLALAPILLLGFLEAIFGMYQFLTNAEDTRSYGTFTNWDHYAGYLEIILPLSVVFGLACLRKNQDRIASVFPLPTISACAVWAGSVLILVSIINSLSRTGFVVALAALFIVVVLCINPRRMSPAARLWSVAALLVLLVVLFIFLPPQQLIERFAGLSSSDKLIVDDRPAFWRESLSLIADYPLFGVGTGAFESTFTKHQAVALGLRVQFAHNDYLQYLAEFGLVGCSILLTALAGVLLPLFKGLNSSIDTNRRLLAIGCLGSICALALHSFVDFNSYVPATAMTIAWIIGTGCANGELSRASRGSSRHSHASVRTLKSIANRLPLPQS